MAMLHERYKSQGNIKYEKVVVTYVDS